MIKIIQEKKPKYFFHIINFSPLKQLRYELNFVNRENSYYRERLEMQARRALIQQRLSQIPLLDTMILFRLDSKKKTKMLLKRYFPSVLGHCAVCSPQAHLLMMIL